MKTKSELREEIHAKANAKRIVTMSRVAFKRGEPAWVDGKRNWEREEQIQLFWDDARFLKYELRHLYLAYAFVRGRRYWVTERSTDTLPDPAVIAAAAGAPDDLDLQGQIKDWLRAHVDKDEVIAYVAAAIAAGEARRARAIARREAIKAERAAE